MASGGALVLAGSVVATHPGSIEQVWTKLITCAPGDSGCPTLSAVLGGEPFTEHTFASQDLIPVAAGQQAKVDVTISFAPTP